MVAKQYSKPAPPLLIRLGCPQPRLGWAGIDEVFANASAVDMAELDHAFGSLLVYLRQL